MTLVDWLLAEDQKDLFELLLAVGLTILFLALILPLLWPLGRLPLAWDLGVGFGFLWAVLWGTALLGALLQRVFRMNIHERSTAYVITGLVLGGLVQVGWSAFAAYRVYLFIADASFWSAAVLHFIGLLSCLVSFFVVSTVYEGAIYRLVNLSLAAVSFLVFSLWPEGVGRLFAALPWS